MDKNELESRYESICEMLRIQNEYCLRPGHKTPMTVWNYFGKNYYKKSKHHNNFYIHRPYRNKKKIIECWAYYMNCSLSDARKIINKFPRKI